MFRFNTYYENDREAIGYKLTSLYADIFVKLNKKQTVLHTEFYRNIHKP